MSLPASDAFAYSSGALETVSSGAWAASGGGMLVSSGQDVRSDSANPMYYWTADVPNDAQYSELKLTSVGSDILGPAVRCATAEQTGYIYQGGNSGAGRSLVYWDAGSDTTIASYATGFSANDTLRLEASGTTLTPKVNGSLDANIGEQTDANISSGRLGIGGVSAFAYDTDGDNWAGGNLVVASELEQEGFRWREDDGDEDGASWIENQDVDMMAPAGENKRLRVLINATGDPASKDFKLQYREVGAASWRDVP